MVRCRGRRRLGRERRERDRDGRTAAGSPRSAASARICAPPTAASSTTCEPRSWSVRTTRSCSTRPRARNLNLIDGCDGERRGSLAPRPRPHRDADGQPHAPALDAGAAHESGRHRAPSRRRRAPGRRRRPPRRRPHAGSTGMGDLERLVGRIGTGSASPRDLLRLTTALAQRRHRARAPRAISTVCSARSRRRSMRCPRCKRGSRRPSSTSRPRPSATVR